MAGGGALLLPRRSRARSEPVGRVFGRLAFPALAAAGALLLPATVLGYFRRAPFDFAQGRLCGACATSQREVADTGVVARHPGSGVPAAHYEIAQLR